MIQYAGSVGRARRSRKSKPRPCYRDRFDRARERRRLGAEFSRYRSRWCPHPISLQLRSRFARTPECSMRRLSQVCLFDWKPAFCLSRGFGLTPGPPAVLTDNGSCQLHELRRAAGRTLRLVALPFVLNLLLCAEHLFVEAMVAIASAGRVDDGQCDLFSRGILIRTWLQSRRRKEGFPVLLSRASTAPACRLRLFRGVWD